MIIEKWISALESGKYKQNKQSLISKDGQSYCVIGVLCDLIDSDGWKTVFEKSSSINHLNISISWHDCSPYCIPPEIKNILRENKFEEHFVRYIIKLNDEGQSFANLARIIRMNARYDKATTCEQII